MIIDGRNLLNGTTIESDICIVGAGAAGISLALEIASVKCKLTLLESGGLASQMETQKLAIGESSGTVLPQGNHYLYSSRLRYFGGSTNHWAGYTRPLDPLDFEKRDWIAHSGWPFPFSELSDGYQKAASYLGVRSFDHPLSLRKKLKKRSILRQSDLFTTKYFHIAPKLRFREHHLPHFRKHKNSTLILNATAVELLAQEEKKIGKIKALTLDKNKIFFKARYFVLAAGGIENPRLLLLSNHDQKKGLGNQNDLVGRFFMEHPHLPAGRSFMKQEVHLLKYYKRHRNKNLGHFISGTLCPTETILRKYQLLNLNIQLVRRFVRLKNGKLVDHSSDLGEEREGPYPLLTSGHEQGSYVHLKVRAEQSPNPESRVILSREKDELGCPRAQLKWLLRDQDLISIQKNLEFLGRELGRYGLGRVQSYLDHQRTWPRFTYGGSHHMGTTRMHNNPREGVVDSNLKLHGCSNLFILGSSVFPTGGGVNPTLTIIALASRLAKHLRTCMQKN